MKYILQSMALILMTTQMASAALLIEPYIGHKIITDGEQGSTEYETNGLAFGGRLGYQQLGLMGGIDFNTSSFDLKTTTSTATTESDASSNDLGLFVGYNAPILVRAWATYFLSSTLDFKDSANTEYKGSGYALGLGYTGFPFLSVNFEYRQKTFEEADSDSGSSSLGTDADINEILLSVSLPLTF